MIQRYAQIDDMPMFKAAIAKTPTDRIEIIVASLLSRGNSKLRKVETLKNAINALFSKTLDEKTLDDLIKELVKKKIIHIDNGSVHYELT